MPFATGAILLDDFTRSNEGPPPGASWAAWYNVGLKVISNQLAPNGTGLNDAYHRMAMPSADVEAYLTVATLPVSDGWTRVHVRTDPAGGGAGNGDGYCVEHYVSAGTDQITLYRLDNSVTTSIGGWAQNLSAGDKVGIRCEGTSIQAWVYTSGAWTMVGSATDATYSGLSPTNKVGIVQYGNGGSGARYDDFYAGPTVAQATPTLTVYLGDNSDVLVEPASWTDITDDVTEASWTRGRQRELDEVQAGSGTLTLDNRARKYDPSYTSGTYYPLRVMRQVKIEATLLGVTYPLFRGHITAYRVRYEPEWESGTNTGYSETQLSLSDGIALLAMSDAPAAYTQKTAEARIDDILTAISWPTALKSLSADGLEVIAKTYTGIEGDTAWELIQEATRSGAADTPTFINGSGVVVREGNTATGYTLGDAGGEIRYSAGDAVYDVMQTRNVVIVSAEGFSGVYSDRTGNPSVRYGFRVYQRATLNVSNADCTTLATAIYNLRSEPLWRPESVTVRPGYKPIALAAMLDLELQDTITLKRRPPGSGTITQTVAVAGLECHWGPPGEWSVTYRLAGTTV